MFLDMGLLAHAEPAPCECSLVHVLCISRMSCSQKIPAVVLKEEKQECTLFGRGTAIDDNKERG
jgi:hypothetical protein